MICFSFFQKVLDHAQNGLNKNQLLPNVLPSLRIANQRGVQLAPGRVAPPLQAVVGRGPTPLQDVSSPGAPPLQQLRGRPPLGRENFPLEIFKDLHLVRHNLLRHHLESLW